MSLYHVIRDQVCGSLPDNAELEFRIPVAPRLIDTVRKLYAGSRPCKHAVDTVLYNDGTDVRGVGDNWQRKRTVRRVRMPCGVNCNMVLSVESPARPLPDVHYRTVQRERWSYGIGSWRVDFTRSTRSSNIEVEYVGDLAALACSLCGLEPVLDSVLAHMAFSVAGAMRGAAPATADMPYVRVDAATLLTPTRERDHYVRLMQYSQPVSMRASSRALDCPLVSVKYDGVRVVLCVKRWRGHWYAVGVCRRGMPYCVPCLTATMEMVLDCEYVHSARTFVVFDVFAARGRVLKTDYRQRLRDLAQLPLPVLAGLSLVRKVMYPLCALTQKWYDDRCSEELSVDGVIVHCGSSVLGQGTTMYKWKPKHTVDLYVGPLLQMMDGRYTPFLYLDPERAKPALVKGEIWECGFSQNGKCVYAIRRRNDKIRANARHVCREILQAHCDNLSICAVQNLLTVSTPIRTSKRQRR